MESVTIRQSFQTNEAEITQFDRFYCIIKYVACEIHRVKSELFLILYLSVDLFNLCKICNVFIVYLLFLLCFVLCKSLFMAAFSHPSFSSVSPTTDITVPHVQGWIVHLTLVITQICGCCKCFQAILTLKLFLPGMCGQFMKFKFLICRVRAVTLITCKRARIFSPNKGVLLFCRLRLSLYLRLFE